MLYIFRLLILLINIDQPSPNVSFETLRILIENLSEKIQDGLTLADIENIIFFILFLRFLILAIRYNLKTSFYITCIGIFAGYFWYKHLIDLISMYRSVLVRIPFFHEFGMETFQLRSFHRQIVLTDIKEGETAHWYNPGQILYSAFKRGIINIDPETGIKYYIDPISMLISNFQEPIKSKVLPIYYDIYNKIIPKIFEICSKFWTQLSGVAAYAVITRLGKRYCPYLIRWHWTFLLILGLIEQILIYFIYRVYYFQNFILIPQTSADPSLIFQINLVNGLITFLVVTHLGFILFGLFHALCGQYFYLPFLVKNTELHVGPRPKNSIYSGGYTAWQDTKEKNGIWYGWFGRGRSQNNLFLKSIKKLLKTVQKLFGR